MQLSLHRFLQKKIKKSLVLSTEYHSEARRKKKNMKKLFATLLVGILLTASLFAWGNSNTSKTTTTRIESLSTKGLMTYVTEEKSSSKPNIKIIFLSDKEILLSRSPYTSMYKSEYYIINQELFIERDTAWDFFDEHAYDSEDFVYVGLISDDEQHLLIICSDYYDELVRQ